MIETNTYTVKFRRRREAVTNYRKRISLLKSDKPRLVIRRFLNNLSAQIIIYADDGDKVLVSTHSKELDKFGWNANKGNIPAAYLVGLLIGKKATKNNIKEVVLDTGLNVSTKGSRIYAALKGAVDAGLVVPHSKEILPDDNRIKGIHISEEVNKLFESVKERIGKE